MLLRRKTKKVKIGQIAIGGKEPIRIQSMTNTLTSDVRATVKQIKNLEKAGCELVRVAIPDKASAMAISRIKPKINIPIIADIHFDYKLAVMACRNQADKIRINPGNIKPKGLLEIIAAAKHSNIPIRIGVNSGSIETDILKKFKKPKARALVASAKRQIDFFQQRGFSNLVISVKHSDVIETVKANEQISKFVDYPLHLGVTEAGFGSSGLIKSALAFGVLLYQGIGDTIRVSLSQDPKKEIEAGRKMLSFLGLRKAGVEIISCPTCARTCIDVEQLAKELERSTKNMKKQIKVAVMGCLVNGPGEAKQADFGVSGMDSKNKELMYFEKGKVKKKITCSEAKKFLIKKIETYRCTK
ncbi:MAG: flavodoxin-dependent (E)-4-hydroxy-3-methylbut-2-enyl-diphosphate synthase [Candidatus Moranbacteria bacterium]|nr:flavodoxin-dependent (E)-4-hydroxy-3-methylbut-2-enyl-diphosphate synthase [Candidatus Moranbacteria bacterium]